MGDDLACPAAPLGLLAELTHRCPLQCPYCSNPLTLERPRDELPTAIWLDVLTQAADLGVLQLHLSGGEPTVRRDLEAIVAQAAKVGLYSNLITSGVALDRRRLEALAEAGLDHVQISVQDVDAENADRIAHMQGAHTKKLQAARLARAVGLPLTLNAPIHRQNIHSVPAFIALAVELGAQRLEIAHVQYYGWALANRASLMPTRAQVLETVRAVDQARDRLHGALTIDFVAPDYYAVAPKPCMGGWGRGIINITPFGRVLPCHAAETIPQVRECATREAARHLAHVASLSGISRHALDARALPHMRAQDARLGRMPLSGLRVCGLRGGSRSGVREIPLACGIHGDGRTRGD